MKREQNFPLNTMAHKLMFFLGKGTSVDNFGLKKPIIAHQLIDENQKTTDMPFNSFF